jgi:hypothetical protein
MKIKNIHSFIEQELFTQIIMADNLNDFSTNQVSQPFTPVSIFSSIPSILLSSPKETEVKATLTVESHNFQKLYLPCNFKILLLPLKIHFISLFYPLCLKDSNFHLQLPHVYAGEMLRFELKVLHSGSSFEFLIIIQSLPENESRQPTCHFNQHFLTIVFLPKQKNNFTARFPF